MQIQNVVLVPFPMPTGAFEYGRILLAGARSQLFLEVLAKKVPRTWFPVLLWHFGQRFWLARCLLMRS